MSLPVRRLGEALRLRGSRIAMFAALVVAALVAVGLVTWRYQVVTRDNEMMASLRASERAGILAGLLSDSIGATLRQAGTLHDLARLLTEARLAGDVETETRLRDLLGKADGIGGPDVAQVAAIGPDGRVLWSTRNWTPNVDVADRPFYAAFVADPQLGALFSPPMLGRVTGEETIQFARAMRGPAGSLRAVTVLSLRAGMLARLSRDIDFTPGDNVMLVGDDGTVLMRRDLRGAGAVLPAGDPTRAIRHGVLQAARPSPLDAVQRYVAVRPIGGHPLSLHVGLSQAAQMAALAGTAETLWQWTLLMDAAILMAALVAAGYLLLLRRATVASARVAAGLRNEAWFRSVLDGMADGVLVVNRMQRSGGKIDFANLQAGVVFGTTPEDLLGRTMADVLDPSEFPRLVSWRSRLAAGEAAPEEVYRAIRLDGTPMWMAASAVSVPDLLEPDSLRVILTVRDVTEQHTREEALAEARARIDRMLQVIPGVFYQLRVGADGEMKVAYISESVRELFGVAPEIAMQAGFLSSRTDVNLAAARRAALLRAGEGRVGVAEYGVRLDDRSCWVRDMLRARIGIDGTMEVVGFLSDATAEHAADTARRTAEEALRRVNWALNAYSRSLAMLLRSGPLSDTMERICEGIVAEPTYAVAAVAVPQPDMTVRIMAAAGPARAYLDGISISWSADDPRGRGPAGRALRSGQAEILNDVTTGPEFEHWRERALAFGIRSTMTMPCVVDGKVVAAVMVYGSEPGLFQPEVLEVFHRLAEEVGLAITIELDRGRLRAAEQSLLDSARLGPGLLYRARAHPAGVEVFDVVGEPARVTANIAGTDGAPATLAGILGAPEPLEAMWALADDAAGSLDFALGGIDGATRWLRNSVRVARRDDGGLDVVGYLSEVTQEKQQQLQRQQLTTLLTLGEMATGLAHELNQPLASISFTAENAGLRLGQAEPDVPGALQRIAKITREVERAARLIDHMRIFARNEHEAPRPVSWSDTLDAALEILHPKLAGFQLTRNLPAGLPDVAGVPIPMEQVLINLIANAVDAYGAVGPGQRREIDVSAATRDGNVVLRVSDRAGGIPPAVLPRLFEPFFTTKPPGKGTGLGLSLVFGAVVEMGGSITAANEGGGAVFEVTLPVAA